jgi:hypothetical protein
MAPKRAKLVARHGGYWSAHFAGGRPLKRAPTLYMPDLPNPEQRCGRCGGYHDATECLVDEMVSEIAHRFPLFGGPYDPADVQSHLEAIGAGRDVALVATARWCGDNEP